MFIAISLNKNIYYRGIEGEYDPKFMDTQHIIWVTQDEEYAREYAYDGELHKFHVNIRNPFNFRFRTLGVHVKIEDIFGRIQVQLMEQYEKNKLTAEKADKLLDELDEIRDKYKRNRNLKRVWEWWTEVKEITHILKKMGFDCIEAYEGLNDDIKTYGLFYKKMMRKV